MESREDFTKANPLKSEEEEEEEEEKQRFKQYLVNRIIQLRMKRLFPMEDSGTAGQSGPGDNRPYTGAKIPQSPSLGNTTTKTPGFGKLSPSGTGLKDQGEEEEETITFNGVRYRREDAAAKLDKEPESPKGEEEEVAYPNSVQKGYNPDGNMTNSNPLLSVAAQKMADRGEEEDNVGANPTSEEKYPDVVPIEASAPSMPLGQNNLWSRVFHKGANPYEVQQKALDNLNKWNEAFKPQA